MFPRPLLALLALLPAAAHATVPTNAPPKIACIGDSITEGSGLNSPGTEAYPARVQRLLGTNYVVRNYGVSGRTLLKKGDFPYWKESAYVQSRNWGPDIVTIKLGTNDSKPYNWRYGTNFVAELEEFIVSYQSLPSHPRVILCTPAPVYAKGAFDISPGVIATNIAPAVRELAARLGLEVIDFHTRLAGHGEWFPDTVHPNTRGAAVMAAITRNALLRVTDPPPPMTLGIGSISPTRAVISWPGEGAGLVLQAATRLGLTNSWTVSDYIPINDGTTLRFTNTVNVPRYFRLWQPE